MIVSIIVTVAEIVFTWIANQVILSNNELTRAGAILIIIFYGICAILSACTIVDASKNMSTYYPKYKKVVELVVSIIGASIAGLLFVLLFMGVYAEQILMILK